MGLPNRIVALREAREISQTDFANRLGINRSVVNRIEKGTRPVRDDELKSIARFFNVSIDYLLGNDENPKSKSNESAELSKDERQLLSIYRGIPKDKRSSTMNIFKTLAESFGVSPAV